MKSQDIKKYGLSLGYSAVGITDAEDLTAYIDEVVSRGEKYELLEYTTTNPIKDAKPKEIMPCAKSVIVLVWDYFQYDFPEELKQMIGKAYMARAYTPPQGTVAHARVQLMKDYLTNGGCVVNSTIGLPARWMATKAGVTEFGKNNFAYHKEAGSYILITTLVIDKELEYDKPTMGNKCSPNCRLCMDACPTKAIYEPFKLDPRRCISFNNWVTQDNRGNISSFVPYELRNAIGTKIHGCDICQDVCPRNQKKLKASKPIDKYIELIKEDFQLEKILNMSDDYFNTRIYPVLYNYIKDKRYLSRNAAIAMGNSKDEKYAKDLKIALKNPDEMIREYAVWALGEIGGETCSEILSDCYESEKSEKIKDVIKKTLESIER